MDPNSDPKGVASGTGIQEALSGDLEALHLADDKEKKASESYIHSGEIDSPFPLECCGACSSHFEYCLPDGSTVKIIVGSPGEGGYKAISHVWGKTTRIHLKCKECSSTRTIPLRSADKFKNLMRLAGSGSTIWLDVLSIDQENVNDKITLVSKMGGIYANAESVSVLLPPQDGDAYKQLLVVSEIAKKILGLRNRFAGNAPQDEELDQALSNLCQQFDAGIAEFQTRIGATLYWKRAWTFQEWSMARDIELGWDASSPAPILQVVKRAILLAGLTRSEYKLKQGQYAVIDLGFSRGMVPARFEVLKQLFPHEELFLPWYEIDEAKLQFQTMMPSLGVDQLLGLRQADFPDQQSRIKARLSILLNAFGVNKREARLEADLVCSWASMCNVIYDSRPSDSYAVALQKALVSLRNSGITIYNFHVNTEGAGGEIDLTFLEYAGVHPQCNARNNAPFLGAPVFTGRADTALHISKAFVAPTSPVQLQGRGLDLQQVKKAEVVKLVSFNDIDKVITTFRMTLSGSVDNFTFTDVVEDIKRALANIDSKAKGERLLVIAAIPFKAKGGNLHAWSVCRKDLAKDLFVARESINGTLVLAAKEGKNARIAGYLTISDQQSGTFLIKTDASGQVKIGLSTPLRSDVINSAMLGQREIQGVVKLKSDVIKAF